MKAHPAQEHACPLAAVDRRLADAHRLWHQAEHAYFDPDAFRLAIQNAIQVLRTVTFILQKNKALIPGFDQWYGTHDQPGQWQKRLSSDPLMRWMVEARNRIEKQGDLESRSMVRAEIVASYLDEGPRIEVPAQLFDAPRTLVQSIPDNALGEHVRRNGMLRIQRRWVEESLPDYELLDAVAITYGKLAELVHDAHCQIGLDPPRTIHDGDGTSYDLPAMGWRFPCMVQAETPRTLMISLADGRPVEFETKHVQSKVDAKAIAALVKRYGGNPFAAMRLDYETEADLAAGYFALARTVFLRDGHHLTILFLFRERKLVRTPIQVVFENVQQKYAVMRKLAGEVVTSGADAAILVGEAWLARADQLKPYQRAADSPDRLEALMLDLVSKTSEPLALMAEIRRKGRRVALEETVTMDTGAFHQFAPFYEAWGRSVPASWDEASRAAMAAGRS